jgi:hypothetical protein
MLQLGKGVCALVLAGLALVGLPSQAALNTSKVLVLENSVVDLTHNIEILRFDWTKGQDFCDVYASVYGNKRPSSTCNLFNDYTTPRFTSQNGWRIGNGNELYDLFKQLAPSWYTPDTASWITFYYTPGIGDWSKENLGGTYSVSAGYESFIAATLRNDTPTNASVTTLDLINYADGSAGLRASSGNISGNTHVSTLLVRDWSGEERPLFGVPLTFGFSAVLLACWFGGRQRFAHAFKQRD